MRGRTIFKLRVHPYVRCGFVLPYNGNALPIGPPFIEAATLQAGGLLTKDQNPVAADGDLSPLPISLPAALRPTADDAVFGDF